MENLLEEIASLESENESVEDKAEDQIKKRRARDQSRIAWVIIWAFVICVGVIFVYVIVDLVLGGGCTVGDSSCTPDRWEEPAKFLLSIVSSILLPVVTLVLGYYFGKEKTE